jgi:sugar/nucleoside kinase (ribokinase family)
LAVSLVENRSLEKALIYANACGALATTKFGAQPSLPNKDEADELIRRRPLS